MFSSCKAILYLIQNEYFCVCTYSAPPLPDIISRLFDMRYEIITLFDYFNFCFSFCFQEVSRLEDILGLFTFFSATTNALKDFKFGIRVPGIFDFIPIHVFTIYDTVGMTEEEVATENNCAYQHRRFVPEKIDEYRSNRNNTDKTCHPNASFLMIWSSPLLSHLKPILKYIKSGFLPLTETKSHNFMAYFVNILEGTPATGSVPVANTGPVVACLRRILGREHPVLRAPFWITLPFDTNHKISRAGAPHFEENQMRPNLGQIERDLQYELNGVFRVMYEAKGQATGHTNCKFYVHHQYLAQPVKSSLWVEVMRPLLMALKSMNASYAHNTPNASSFSLVNPSQQEEALLPTNSFELPFAAQFHQVAPPPVEGEHPMSTSSFPPSSSSDSTDM